MYKIKIIDRSKKDERHAIPVLTNRGCIFILTFEQIFFFIRKDAQDIKIHTRNRFELRNSSNIWKIHESLMKSAKV